MKTITQKFRILPLSRKQDILDTEWYRQMCEGHKAFQLVKNEMIRIAAHIEDYPEFQSAKGGPNFPKMNSSISQWRTHRVGLDNLPEFKYYRVKNLKEGGVRIINKSLPNNRYTNEDGKCWAYDLLNKISARSLNHIYPELQSSWYTKGKKVNYYAPKTTKRGLGWEKSERARLPVHPTHICDGDSISTSNTVKDGVVYEGEYKLEINEANPERSTLHHFAGVKEKIRVVIHRPLMGEPKTAKIARDGDEFYLCLTITLDSKSIPTAPKKPKNTTGLDFGIKDHIVDDQNNTYNFPKDERLEKKITKLQQKLCLQTQGSNNWKKTKAALNKLHRHQTRIHNDQIHNFTSKVTNEFDGIAYEDYKPSQIVKKTQDDPKLYNKQKQAINRKALAGGIHKIKSQIDYKSQLRGVVAVAVDPAYTTQECSCCGFVNTELSNNLEIREWDCPECGAHHSRDQNAAQNIKKAAFG